MSGGGPHPLFIFFDFVQHQPRKHLLPILRDLPQAVNRIVEYLTHVEIIALARAAGSDVLEMHPISRFHIGATTDPVPPWM